MNIIQFRRAIKEADTSAISEGLRAGFTVEHRFQKGQAALHVATAARSAETVTFLLAQGADVNSESDRWETPLDLAEKMEAKDLITLLSKHGGKRGPDLSLHAACYRGSIAHVRAHLAAGADANAKRHDELPICIALRGQHTAIAKLLLPKTCTDAVEAGATPLHAAAEGGASVEVLELLAKHGFSINAQDDRGQTALSFAARRGNSEAVKFLIQKGADPDLSDPKQGDSPISAALFSEEWDTARLLIDLGADADIHDASKANHLSKVRELIESGVDVDTPNCVGDSPLHIAVEGNLHELAEFLLKSGASPNLQDNVWEKYGYGAETPLHEAVYKGDAKMVRLLMTHKGDSTIKNFRGLRPLDIAEARKQPHLVRLLKVAPPQKTPPQPPSPPPAIGQFYTIEAVVQLLNVDTDFILKLIKEKKLKTVKLAPEVLRIPAASLAEYLASLSQEP